MTKTIRDLDVEMHKFLYNLDPVNQAYAVYGRSPMGNPHISELLSHLEKAAPYSHPARVSHDILKSGRWNSYQQDFLAYIEPHNVLLGHKVFTTHNLKFNSVTNTPSQGYVPYYYKLMPTNNQALINESIKMSGVSAGPSAIWVVDKAKVIPEIVVKGCINNVQADAFWIGAESVGCAILGIKAGPTGALTGAAGCALVAATISCVLGGGAAAIDDYKDYSNSHHQSDSGYGDSFSSNNYPHSSNDYVSVCVSGTGNFDHCP